MDRTGHLDCWGDDSQEQVSDIPRNLFAVQLSVGFGHSCALMQDGTLSCWGLNEHGQTAAPTGSFLQVDAGGHHSCAVNAASIVECWGKNASGQLNAP